MTKGGQIRRKKVRTQTARSIYINFALMYSDLEWLAFTLVFWKLHRMCYKFKKIQYLDKK